MKFTPPLLVPTWEACASFDYSPRCYHGAWRHDELVLGPKRGSWWSAATRSTVFGTAVRPIGPHHVWSGCAPDCTESSAKPVRRYSTVPGSSSKHWTWESRVRECFLEASCSGSAQHSSACSCGQRHRRPSSLPSQPFQSRPMQQSPERGPAESLESSRCYEGTP